MKQPDNFEEYLLYLINLYRERLKTDIAIGACTYHNVGQRVLVNKILKRYRQEKTR
ncbi:MAG: hypothetical protein H8E35_10110 [Ardenticatenia bacterium]|nr:hypothetical protein [Ardenticatenia bacterium]